MAMRAYAGAMGGRLPADWVAAATSATAEIRGSLRTLRARARALERDDDHVRAWLRALEVNVVGHAGIQLQMDARRSDGTPDTAAARAIEEAWRDWSRRGTCTMDGRLSWRDAQRLVMRSIARDGEVLIRLVRGPAARNAHGLALQILEADHLDEADDRDLPGGRRVRMGVEIDEWDRTRALHLLSTHPGDAHAAPAGTRRVRIPARDVLHPYLVERPSQLRGVPWLVSAITTLRHLGMYTEAEVVAARGAAAKMGFFSPDPDADPASIGETGPDGAPVMEAEPGQFDILPAGYRLHTWDPQHPSASYEAFVRALLRGVAAGVGCSYATVSADLSDTTYSSLRQGALSERDMWRVLQDWLTEVLVRPVHEAWMEMAALSGAIDARAVAAARRGRAAYVPRGWDWVDPAREVRAAAEEIGMGLRSHGEVIASSGRDIADVLARRRAEMDMAADMGVDLPRARPRGAAIGDGDGDGDGDD
jgi:lambda family phage portal protein